MEVLVAKLFPPTPSLTLLVFVALPLPVVLAALVALLVVLVVHTSRVLRSTTFASFRTTFYPPSTLVSSPLKHHLSLDHANSCKKTLACSPPYFSGPLLVRYDGPDRIVDLS